MTKERQNFIMYQGESKLIEAPVVDSDGNPLDMTGATIEWKAFDTTEDTTPSIEKSTASGNISVIDKNATNDGLRITLVPADTESLVPEVYYHECRVIDSVGNEEVVFSGFITLKLSKTK